MCGTVGQRQSTRKMATKKYTSVEICAGAGGQALGVEMAGFEHKALVEIDEAACATLRLNRPQWNVLEMDINHVQGAWFGDVDLLSGGVPCPPFSVAGKQLGEKDERNLFPQAIRLVSEIKPKAVMFENVRGIFDQQFDGYRDWIGSELAKLGYKTYWNLLQASEYGVSQLRPRALCVALRKDLNVEFEWPMASLFPAKSVGELLYDLMKSEGWQGAEAWRDAANEIAPTLVGGSKKHGGADLGPTRARKKWASLGVDGSGLADDVPCADFQGLPKLTIRMAARIQGFPDGWKFYGRKTTVYRQIGNAFPPPVAQAVAVSIKKCLEQSSKKNEKENTSAHYGRTYKVS